VPAFSFDASLRHTFSTGVENRMPAKFSLAESGWRR
jgi:hypothetical protein